MTTIAASDLSATSAVPLPRLSCDRCTVARAVVVVVRGAGELQLCKHHYERHDAALSSQGWRVVVDTRGDLR